VKAKIFIAEDDPDISELIAFNLEVAGYSVERQASGHKAYEMILADPPDLLLLDLNLPGLSGIEICKYLRQETLTKDLPIIMITARSQEMDKIIGLNTGADDYITKPFSVKELMARVNAILRRTKSGLNEIYENGNFLVDFSAVRVFCREEEIVLTPVEFKLISILIAAKGRVLSRAEILDIVWENDALDERTVDVNIKRLRDKLGNCSGIIETVKGAGYRITKK